MERHLNFVEAVQFVLKTHRLTQAMEERILSRMKAEPLDMEKALVFEELVAALSHGRVKCVD